MSDGAKDRNVGPGVDDPPEAGGQSPVQGSGADEPAVSEQAAGEESAKSDSSSRAPVAKSDGA